jgi:hypothetical protein
MDSTASYGQNTVLQAGHQSDLTRRFIVWDGANTILEDYITGTFVADTTYEAALCFGGFDSLGTPSAQGDYGAMHFYKDGTTWYLHSLTTKNQLAATYPGYLQYGTGTTTLDNIKLPNSSTRIPEVFTPEGYFLDTFTDVDTTNITDHTSDSGGTWTVAQGAFNIQSPENELNCTANTAFDARVLTDVGRSDGLFVARMKTGAFWATMIYRYQDSSNFWAIINEVSPGPNFKINQISSGSEVTRSSVAGTGVLNTFQTITLRLDGDLHEAWLDGGSKVSYTDVGLQTETQFGIRNRNIGDRTSHFYSLPLTSTTYDTYIDSV